MAMTLKEIPVLEGKDAKRFLKKAEKAFKGRGKVDFSKQMKDAETMLIKSGMMFKY